MSGKIQRIDLIKWNPNHFHLEALDAGNVFNLLGGVPAFTLATFGAMFSAKKSRLSYLSPMVTLVVKFPWKWYINSNRNFVATNQCINYCINGFCDVMWWGDGRKWQSWTFNIKYFCIEQYEFRGANFLKWCPIFDSLPLCQFKKYNNALWVSWFLGQNLSTVF